MHPFSYYLIMIKESNYCHSLIQRGNKVSYCQFLGLLLRLNQGKFTLLLLGCFQRVDRTERSSTPIFNLEFNFGPYGKLRAVRKNNAILLKYTIFEGCFFIFSCAFFYIVSELGYTANIYRMVISNFNCNPLSAYRILPIGNNTYR